MNRIYLISLLLLSQAIGHAQIDSIPPDIFCPPADTVTLSPGGDCTFQFFYSVVSSDNEPGDTLVQLSGLESGADFPIGTTVNVFQAIDAAGNTATCSFQLTVQNYAGPLNCKNDISVSLDSTCAWIPEASDLLIGNAGCTVGGYYLLEVDKDPPYGNGPWEPAIFGYDDIGKSYVFQVSDTVFNYTCTGNLQINDNLPPSISCQDITISCAVDNVSPYFLRDSLGISGAVPVASDGCSQVMLNYVESTVDSGCTSGLVGVISRNWSAKDEFDNSSTCLQQIFLTRPVISDLQYPPDTSVNCSADLSPAATGQPYILFAGQKWTNTCSLGTAANDTIIQTSACSSQLIRTWFVIDWCNGDALEHVQTIEIQDTLGPTFLNCPDSTVVIGDTSATNDPELWNAPHWANPQSGMENLCEGPVDLTAVATDNCSAINPALRYLLFLDLDNDGTQETVIDSDTPPAAGTVNFGNAANPNYAGGESRSFDERPLDSLLKYRFALQTVITGDTVTSRVVWNTDSITGQYTTPQLPYGTHKIRWMTQDSCGNEAVCEYEFTVKDARPPDVVCADTALVLNIFSGGTSTLFLSGISPVASDNCTPSDLLLFGIRKGGAGTGFPSDTSVFFDCNDYFTGGQSIEIWAQDLNGNASFCEMDIALNDPSQGCDPAPLTVTGALKTETNDGIENAHVNLQSGNISLFDVTDDQGAYSFPNALFPASNFTITPTKNDDPLNGVSTYDLVLISKHILGLELLPSPYKMIAADANHSDAITTFDIVEFRKLILGIYDSLPANTSWRFVDKDFVFPDPANPFQTPFPESISYSNAQTILPNDFVGVKIGDVNNTVIPNSLVSTDDRSNGTLLFDVKDRAVDAGEVFNVSFKADQRVQGWQFTLNLSGLELIDIEENDLVKEANFGVFGDAITTSVDVPTTSTSPTGEFSLTFRAVKSGLLNQMLGVSSRITHAEAYSLASDRLDVALRFNGAGAATVSNAGFQLYQNQPNPFSDKTVIGFQLPENANATFSIFDETGRTVYTQSENFTQGYHEVVLEKSLLDRTGVLYYKLETATECAVRKMVIIK